MTLKNLYNLLEFENKRFVQAEKSWIIACTLFSTREKISVNIEIETNKVMDEAWNNDSKQYNDASFD